MDNVPTETGETTYGLPIDWKARAEAAEARVRVLEEACRTALSECENNRYVRAGFDDLIPTLRAALAPKEPTTEPAHKAMEPVDGDDDNARWAPEADLDEGNSE